MPEPSSLSKVSLAETLSLQQCAYYFNLPIQQAAIKLNVSRPTISKVLRKHGIRRWPYRRLSTKQNLRFGALQNWNESKALAVLATLKNENVEHNEDIPNDSDDDVDDDVSYNVHGPTLSRTLNNGSITGGSAVRRDLKSDTSTIGTKRGSISIKENNSNSSLNPSQQNCNVSTYPQSSNLPPNCESMNNNNSKNHCTPTNSMNSVFCQLPLPVLESSTPPTFSLPPALSYDVESPFNPPITETELDAYYCLLDKQQTTSLNTTAPLDNFNQEKAHIFQSIDHYSPFSKRSLNMVVTTSEQEKGAIVSIDEISQHSNQELGNVCDPEVGFHSVVNISKNENNDEIRDCSVFSDDIGTFKSLNSSVPGTSVSDFGIDRNDLVCPPNEVDNSMLDCDALLLSTSSPSLDPSISTENNGIDDKNINSGDRLFRVQSINNFQTSEADDFQTLVPLLNKQHLNQSITVDNPNDDIKHQKTNPFLQ